MRTTGFIAALTAIGCLVGAGYEYFLAPSAEPLPSFEIAPTEFSLGEVPAGAIPLKTTIKNPARQPRRILGTEGRCIANCCSKSVQDSIVVLSPGEATDVHFLVVASRPGPFEAEFVIYLEENGIRTVTLRVTGTAVEAPRAPK